MNQIELFKRMRATRTAKGDLLHKFHKKYNLSWKEISEILGCTERTVYNYADKNKRLCPTVTRLINMLESALSDTGPGEWIPAIAANEKTKNRDERNFFEK